MKKFNSKSCEEIMTTVYKPIEFVVDGLIAQGLYILAGAPKVGKSWLALDMCLSIAKGEKVLGQETTRGTALYLCLEDSYVRIQNRLYELTDEPVENLHFVILSDTIGKGLEEQIENFKKEHCDLKVVFIDTLQMIRESTDNGYGSDYKELSVMKSLADKLEIAIVVVHHTRKCSDSDPFNMISGSTGLSGCVDGSMVLIENKRGSRNAKLHCVGRDIENQEINLVFENSRWKVVDEATAKEPDLFSFAVHDFMLERKNFKGSATELANELSKILCKEVFANHIKKELMKHAYELQSYGVTFESKRSNGQRVIILKYDLQSDTSDSKNLMPETVNFTDPAVTERSSECVEKPLNTLFEGDKENQKDKNSTDPVSKVAVPVCNSTDPVDEKVCEVRWTTLDEILNTSARKIRSKLASQQKYHALLHSAYGFLVKHQYIDSNPCDFADRPKTEKYQADYYSRAELTKLFSAAENSPVYISVLLAAYYGLRRSEVLGLKWSNIDFENKKIAIAHKVVEQKVNGKYQSVGHDKMKTQSSNRTLPLMPEVETALLELQKHQSEQRRLCRSSYIHKYDDYVCVDEMGKLLRPNYISTQFGKLLKANGLRHIRFHDLRHSCASLQLANGVPMKAIQEWLGHANYRTTADVYSHLDFKSKEKSAEIISKLLAS